MPAGEQSSVTTKASKPGTGVVSPHPTNTSAGPDTNVGAEVSSTEIVWVRVVVVPHAGSNAW